LKKITSLIALIALHTVETFADNLACCGYQYECFGVFSFDEVPEPDCLASAHDGEDDVFVIAGEGAFGVACGCASVKCMHDKVTDRLRFCADDVEVLALVKAFYHVVNHQ